MLGQCLLLLGLVLSTDGSEDVSEGRIGAAPAQGRASNHRDVDSGHEVSFRIATCRYCITAEKCFVSAKDTT